MKILCTADVHIGRRPSRLPAHVDGRAHSCGAGWTRLVERALAERVELVAIAGDLVDRDNRFYEAVGPLEQGFRRLAQAGIPVVLVAGNHDHHVLPWLVEGLEGVTLLGRGGQWERFTLERDGRALHVDGWSFPDAHHRESPLAHYALPEDGTPVLGLLHCDLEQHRSPYAPVTLAELRRRRTALWLLGHVHASRLHEAEGEAPVLYPGSPQAMDPGETGAHGAWLVEIEPGRATARHLPLSSVRYDVVTVEVDGIVEEAELDRRVADAVRAHLAEVAGGSLRWLCCRLRVTGRTPLHRRLEERLRALAPDLAATHGEATAVVEEVVVETRPARDLEEISRGQDAAGVLARLVRALEEGRVEGELAHALRHAERLVTEVRRARPYLHLVDEGAPDVAGDVRRQALRLLDELMAQKEEA